MPRMNALTMIEAETLAIIRRYGPGTIYHLHRMAAADGYTTSQRGMYRAVDPLYRHRYIRMVGTDAYAITTDGIDALDDVIDLLAAS